MGQRFLKYLGKNATADYIRVIHPLIPHGSIHTSLMHYPELLMADALRYLLKKVILEGKVGKDFIHGIPKKS